MRDKIDRAARLFEDFSGEPARHIDTLDVPPMDDTQALVGEVEAIAYNAVRDGEKNSYMHEFRKGSRPLVSTSHDGSQLYLLGGAYRFTERGIEDRKMPSIALVNPSRRKGKKMARRTAAQRAATRKLVALNRSRRRGGTHKAKRRRHSVRAHSVRAHSVKSYHVRRHMSNPVRRRHRRHNPVGMRGFMGAVVPGAIGAAGALGVDVLIGYLPIPPTLQSGLPRKLVQLAGVVGLGWAASKFASRRVGEAILAGGVTVVLYDLMKGYLVQSFPQIPLVPTATVVVPSGAATQAGAAGLSWISPAVTMGDEKDFNYEGMGAYIEGMGDGAVVHAY